MTNFMAPNSSMPLTGQTVLVADDDPILVETLKVALDSFGADRVLIASDGDIAHRILAEHFDLIDLIVLDLRMPNEDGVGFLRLASKLNYRGRIVVNSGERPEVLKGAERLAHLYGLDCIGALQKPFHPALMLELLTADPETRKKTDAFQAQSDEVFLQEVHYQPRVDLRSETCVAAEALSRFKNAHGHPLDTERAIEIAETNGTIEQLTWALVDQMLVDARALSDSIGHPFHISFNVSPSVASHVEFARSLNDKVRAAGFATSSFTVELTETRLAENPAVMLENLTRLRIFEFGLALDDFGTGNANIEQLASYPFTELKIDKRFVTKAEKDRFAATCVEAAVNIGKSLGLSIVAEGVEDEWAHDYVRSLGIDQGQGWLYSKPLLATELADFVVWTKE